MPTARFGSALAFEDDNDGAMSQFDANCALLEEQLGTSCACLGVPVASAAPAEAAAQDPHADALEGGDADDPVSREIARRMALIGAALNQQDEDC